MPALWTYPWTLHRSGIDDACTTLEACGIDALNVASHYHSVRSMQPRFTDDLFESYPGGCYFEPDERFDELAIDAPVNDVGSWDDPLATITEAVHDRDVAVNAWTVLCHNTALASANPDYRFESAFGDTHDHALCPSHSEVRAYYAAVVGAIADRGVDEIQLESVGFPGAFHDHGANFGHDKQQAITGDLEAALLSQCFCDGCRDAAADHEVDLERARERVLALLEPALSAPSDSLPSIAELLAAEPALESLFAFRAAVIGDLLEGLAEASGSTPLNYYAMEAYGLEPEQLRLAGVDLPAHEDYLDRVTALCYVADPETARERIASLEATVDCPVDAGVTLDPDVIERAEALSELVAAIRGATDGKLLLYHHSLATDAHLEWIADAVDA